MKKQSFKYSLIVVVLLLLYMPGWSETDRCISDLSNNETPNGYSDEIRVIDVPELENLINNTGSDIRVINFWATWCKPCIEELPYFEKLNKDPQFDNVEVILISVDFIEDLETKVKKFIDKKDIQSTVMLLDNTDYNSWIDKVDPSWSGAIPATLILDADSGSRKFVEKELQKGELEQLLLEFQ